MPYHTHFKEEPITLRRLGFATASVPFFVATGLGTAALAGMISSFSGIAAWMGGHVVFSTFVSVASSLSFVGLGIPILATLTLLCLLLAFSLLQNAFSKGSFSAAWPGKQLEVRQRRRRDNGWTISHERSDRVVAEGFEAFLRRKDRDLVENFDDLMEEGDPVIPSAEDLFMGDEPVIAKDQLKLTILEQSFPMLRFRKQDPKDTAGFLLSTLKWIINPFAILLSVFELTRLSLLAVIDVISVKAGFSLIGWSTKLKSIVSGLFSFLLPLRGLAGLCNAPYWLVYGLLYPIRQGWRAIFGKPPVEAPRVSLALLNRLFAENKIQISYRFDAPKPLVGGMPFKASLPKILQLQGTKLGGYDYGDLDRDRTYHFLRDIEGELEVFFPILTLGGREYRCVTPPSLFFYRPSGQKVLLGELSPEAAEAFPKLFRAMFQGACERKAEEERLRREQEAANRARQAEADAERARQAQIERAIRQQAELEREAAIEKERRDKEALERIQPPQKGDFVALEAKEDSPAGPDDDEDDQQEADLEEGSAQAQEVEQAQEEKQTQIDAGLLERAAALMKKTDELMKMAGARLRDVENPAASPAQIAPMPVSESPPMPQPKASAKEDVAAAPANIPERRHSF